MTTLNKNCQIHNQSDEAIVVLDTYNKAAKSSDILYECLPSILPTLSGQQTIDASKSDKVKLNDYVSDEVTQVFDDTVYSTDYQLILAQPSNLFPIKYVDEMLHFSTKTYPDITVEKKDKDKVKLAYQLYQFLWAYPTSKLATGFYTALNEAFTKSESAADIEKTMADFFKKTPPYQSLDAPTFASVMTYIASYPNCFALVDKDKKDYLPYYLYSADSTTDEKTDPVYEGRLVFVDKKTPRPAVADPTDGNGGYQILFYNTNADYFELSYNQDQFVSDTTQDFPKICLQGSFLNKRYLTSKKKDNKLIPILVGVINGRKVLGTTDKQHGKDVKADRAFQLPSYIYGIIALLVVFGALAIFCYFSNRMLILLKKKLAEETADIREETGDDNAEPTPEEVVELRENIDAERSSWLARVQRIINRVFGSKKGAPQVPKNEKEFSSDAEATRLEVRKLLAERSGTRTASEVDTLIEQIKILLKYGRTPELNDLYEKAEPIKSDLKKAIKKLKKAKKDDEIELRIKELREIENKSNDFLDKAQKITQAREDELGDEIRADDKTALERNKATMDGLRKESKQAREDEKKAEEGDIDDDAETAPLPEPLEHPMPS